MTSTRSLIGAALLALLLGACAPTGIQPGIDDQRRWQLSGKLGLRAEKLAESAFIHWRQCGEHFDIRLSGPLGKTVARVSGYRQQLTVSIDGREPVTTDQPEALLQAELGWSVPLRALRHWVRAEAAPGARAAWRGEQPQPELLEQLGWQVRYLAYHTHGQGDTGIALPARLQLRGEGLTATLLIRDWLLSDGVEGCPVP
jgi:outer membrane lipoprotein LolB